MFFAIAKRTSETRGVPQRHEGDCQRNVDATNIAFQKEDNSKSYIAATGIFAFDSATAFHEARRTQEKPRRHTWKKENEAEDALSLRIKW